MKGHRSARLGGEVEFLRRLVASLFIPSLRDLRDPGVVIEINNDAAQVLAAHAGGLGEGAFAGRPVRFARTSVAGGERTEDGLLEQPDVLGACGVSARRRSGRGGDTRSAVRLASRSPGERRRAVPGR